MRITEAQQQILDSLICERLSSNSDNLRAIEGFRCCRNEGLEIALQGDAYQDDEKGNIAYYLVKDSDGNILFYFSLKCGLLYDKIEEEARLHDIKRLYEYLISIKDDPSFSQDDKQVVNSILENIRTRKGLVKEDLQKISRTKKNHILEGWEKESADNLKRVGNTFASIEIVHFCANDACRSLWDEFQFDQKLGVVVFWHFIVPKICEARKIVGCQYLFLFAADSTPDAFLVNYYKTNLGFKDATEHGTAIPLYDYACKFMHQEIADIEIRRKYFYDHFNHDKDAV